jgi:hypothetical protein
MSDDESVPVVLHFSASTWRFRLKGYLRELRRPLRVFLLAALAFGPSAFASAAGDADGLAVFSLKMGIAASLVVAFIWGVVAMAQRVPPMTLTLTDRGVQQEIRGAKRTHGWDWVVDFDDEPDAIVIRLKAPPMRSFRLSRVEAQQLVVSKGDLDAGTLARLTALLEANVRR